MVPSRAVKGGKRYRYYVSARLITGNRAGAHDGMRVPAAEVESGVIERIRRFLTNGGALFETLQPLESDGDRLQSLMRRAEEIAGTLDGKECSALATMLRTVVSRIEVRPDQIGITVQSAGLLHLLRRHDVGDDAAQAALVNDIAEPLVLMVPLARRRAGRDTRMLVDGPEATQADPALLRMLIRARELRDKLLQSGDASLAETAKAEGISRTYLTRMARLSFLSPEITTAILNGRQPVQLTAARLSRLTDLRLAWSEQRTVLGLV
jgi:site-specific DNA recombinase